MHIIPSIPLLHSPVRHRKITFTSLTPYQEIYEQMEATTQRILNSRMEVLEREVTVRNDRKKKDLSVSTHIAVGDNAPQRLLTMRRNIK